MKTYLAEIDTGGHHWLVAACILIIFCGCSPQASSQEHPISDGDSALTIRMRSIEEATAPTIRLAPTGDFSLLRIGLRHDWALLLKDAEGRRTGRDPFVDTAYQEIPSSHYAVIGIGDRTTGARLVGTDLELGDPPNGDYVLDIFGTEDTVCGFWINCYYHEPGNNPMEIIFSNIPIALGAVQSYTITLGNIPYAPYEVTGGFAGSENEAAEIDRLLSYVSVAENTTALAAGTDTFNLFLIYGGLANPNTLAAALNGKDVVSLFTRSEKRYEVVKIPLRSGENLLVLAIDGQTVDGPTTDTDSLVFMVE